MRDPGLNLVSHTSTTKSRLTIEGHLCVLSVHLLVLQDQCIFIIVGLHYCDVLYFVMAWKNTNIFSHYFQQRKRKRKEDYNTDAKISDSVQQGSPTTFSHGPILSGADGWGEGAT